MKIFKWRLIKETEYQDLKNTKLKYEALTDRDNKGRFKK